MRKLAEIGLQGLSPETVLQNSQPPTPMETPGYSKAKAIMEMSQTKMASQRHSGTPATLPQIEKLLEKHKEEGEDAADKKKRLAGYMLAGGGSSNFLASKVINPLRHVANFHPPKNVKASKLELALTAAGALGGAAESIRRSKVKAKAKTAAFSPGLQLRNAGEVAKHSVQSGINVGKTAPQQIRGRLMGNKIKVSMAGSEELDRTKAMVLTREDTKAAADAMFGDQAIAARKKERELVAKLFVQAPAAVTMTPVLQKEASIQELAPNTVALLEKFASESPLTEAQKRYPELLKVASGRMAGAKQVAPSLSKSPTAIPTQSVGTGA